jgi:CDP-diacylglycerol---glycerol-3-phosphate 3-phosphatidyltransferase
MNIPTFLTLMRISAIPIVMIVYFLPFSWAHPAAALIFVVAAITDWFDGYLARTWRQITPLGAFLDPVADKLLVAVSLVIVVGDHWLPFLSIPAAIIVGREIAISALREWMAEIGKRASVAVSFVAKFKTAVQLIALVLLLWANPSSSFWIGGLGTLLLYISAALTLWSMIIYLKLAWPDLTLVKEK